MLTGNLVRVRYARNHIIPQYIDVVDSAWREVAERLLELFRAQEGKRRGDLENDVKEAFGDEQSNLVHRGLAKLLEDRCEFEIISGHPPEQIREVVFRTAARHRQDLTMLPESHFDRHAVLLQAAVEMGLSPEAAELGLFADLKSEQKLVRFQDITAEHLLQRYNVALAQAVLLRSTRVHVRIHHEPPRRYRQLLRLVKFHRLVCELEQPAPGCVLLHLDGPLSLFSATQKYGLQLALFLPAVLLCRDFEVRAELKWGPQRKVKTFTLSPRDGLVSHVADSGMYVPPEMAMFVDLFRKKIQDWTITEETDIFPLGDGFWTPDFRLEQRATHHVVYLEVLGFWRRSSAEKHLQRLRQHAPQPFLLAVSDSLRIDDTELEGLHAEVHRFRQMPLPDEVARLATELVQHLQG